MVSVEGGMGIGDGMTSQRGGGRVFVLCSWCCAGVVQADGEVWRPFAWDWGWGMRDGVDEWESDWTDG